jgi:hypothetical protein
MQKLVSEFDRYFLDEFKTMQTHCDFADKHLRELIDIQRQRHERGMAEEEESVELKFI